MTGAQTSAGGAREGRTRVAVIGAGRWGEQHTRVFSSHPDAELCAVVARHLDRAETRASRWGGRPYTSIEDMLSAESPDLVTLSLPNEEHFDATLKVIEAGVPLLAEKPLVFSVQEADALLGPAEAEQLFFAINFNHRYAEPVRRAHDMVQAGQLGDLVFATWRFGGEAGSSSHPHANLIETQCHGFDMLEFLCGPIKSVMAQMTNKTHGVYTTLAVALEFANGAVGSMVGSYDSSYAYPVDAFLGTERYRRQGPGRRHGKAPHVQPSRERDARGLGSRVFQRFRPGIPPDVRQARRRPPDVAAVRSATARTGSRRAAGYRTSRGSDPLLRGWRACFSGNLSTDPRCKAGTVKAEVAR